MSEEEGQDEVVEEEVAEEVVEEQPTTEETPTNECIVIPKHMKPLFECCKDLDEGKIDSTEFFARALVRTGEFMQNVKKKREGEPSE